MRFLQSQTQQETAWSAAHCCYIANGPGEALPANGIRRMLVPQEVCSFQKPVARENRFMARLRTEERRVIANAEGDELLSPPAPRSGAIRNLSHDRIRAL